MSYYIGSAFSSTGSSDFTCIFYDSTGYTADSTGFTGLDWTTASGFMYVGDDKGAIGWGKTTDSTTDVYTKLTVGATGFKNGIYADTNGLYAVVDGTAIPYDSWGSDPLYTQGDFQDSVIDRLATPPSGVNGERYLIIATASGAWTGHEDEITEYQDGWVFITESEGMMTWVEDEDTYYVYDGSSWSAFGISGDLDLGDYYVESNAWRSNDYDVQIKPLNSSYLHVRNKADTAYKPVAADYFYSNTTANATVDTDKFLVDDAKTIKYRTGAEVLSDIGASATGHTHTGVYEPYDTAIVKSDESETITSDWTLANVTSTGDFKYSAAQVRYHSIPASALIPKYDTNVWANVGYQIGHASTKSYFYAPLHLPDGVAIKSLKVWGNYGADCGDAYLQYVAYGGSSYVTLATVTNYLLSGSETASSAHTVDNSTYHYWVYISTEGNRKYRGGYIKYELTTLNTI